MEYAIEYLAAELDSLKDAWRKDTQGLRDVYISRIIDVKEALCHLKKINERQESTDHSEHNNTKALHIADVSEQRELLIAFFNWYANYKCNIHEGSEDDIVDEYLSN